MHDFHSAPTVIVGVDGSPAASGAAAWAVDEAATRGIPLTLAYVIRRADLLGDDVGSEADQLAAARTALADARHATETSPDRALDPRYPGIAVEPVAVHGSVARHPADNAESIELFVSGTRDRRSLGWAGDTGGCSVLTVGGTHP